MQKLLVQLSIVLLAIFICVTFFLHAALVNIHHLDHSHFGDGFLFHHIRNENNVNKPNSFNMMNNNNSKTFTSRHNLRNNNSSEHKKGERKKKMIPVDDDMLSKRQSQRFYQNEQWYETLRDEVSTDSLSEQVLIGAVENQYQYNYLVIDNNMTYDPFNCPDEPVDGYPYEWPVLDVLENWNPDDADPPSSKKDTSSNERPEVKIYQGLCRFGYKTDHDKILKYREKEVPFIVRHDPNMMQTVYRWGTPNYMSKLFGNRKQQTEFSENNHFMFWRLRKHEKAPEGWKEPTSNVKLTFDEWMAKANNTDLSASDVDKPHWYFRVNAGPLMLPRGQRSRKDLNLFIYDEMPFFDPKSPDSDYYMVEKPMERGMNCRFGMRGVIAENHYDGSRNAIALMGGERRYILAHPKECPNMALYPMEHPSGRHSAVDWSNPDLDAYPQFRNTKVNEVVLQAGDIMYLPTQWFHYIISLGVNFQCNIRSGISNEYSKLIKDCGFA